MPEYIIKNAKGKEKRFSFPTVEEASDYLAVANEDGLEVDQVVFDTDNSEKRFRVTSFNVDDNGITRATAKGSEGFLSERNPFANVGYGVGQTPMSEAYTEAYSRGAQPSVVENPDRSATIIGNSPKEGETIRVNPDQINRTIEATSDYSQRVGDYLEGKTDVETMAKGATDYAKSMMGGPRLTPEESARMAEDPEYGQVYWNIRHKYGITPEEYEARQKKIINARIDDALAVAEDLRNEAIADQSNWVIDIHGNRYNATDDQLKATIRAIKAVKRDLNASRTKYGEKDGWHFGKRFWDRGELIVKLTPALNMIRSLESAGVTFAQANAANKMIADPESLTPEQKLLHSLTAIQQSVAQVQEDLGGKHWASGAGEVISEMPEFMMGLPLKHQFAKGVIKSVTKGASKVLSKVAKEAVEETAEEVAGRATARALEAATGWRKVGNTAMRKVKAWGKSFGEAAIGAPTQTLLYRSLADEALGQYQVRPDGSTIQVITPAWERVYRAWLSTAVELHSEDMGMWIGKGLNALGRRMANVGFVRNIMRIPASKSPLWEVVRKELKVTDPVSEAAGEFYGDAIQPLFTGDLNWDEPFGDEDYWKSTIVASAGVSVALNLPNIKQYKRDGQRIQSLGRIMDSSLEAIENDNLRKQLITAVSHPSLEQQTKALATINWGDTSREDMACAMDYVYAHTQREMYYGAYDEVSRQEQLSQHLGIELSNSYRGESGRDSSMTTVKARAATNSSLPKDAEFYVIAGDYTAPDGFVTVIREDRDGSRTRDFVPVNQLEGFEEQDISAKIAEAYDELFSEQIADGEVSSLSQRIAEMRAEGVAEETIREIVSENPSYHEYKEGDVVTDTQTGEAVTINEQTSTGDYIATKANGQRITISYDQIADSGAYAQQAQTESDAVEEGKIVNFLDADGNTIEGEVSRVYEDGRVDVMVQAGEENGAPAYVGYTILPSQIIRNSEMPAQPTPTEQVAQDVASDVAAVAETTETPQVVAPQAEVTPDAREIPTLEDGSIDYDAIEDPQQFIDLYGKDMTAEELIADVTAFRDDATANTERLNNEVANAKTPNEKKALRDQAKIEANRANKYQAVLDLLMPKAPVAEQTEVAPEVTPVAEEVVEPVAEVAEQTPIAEEQMEVVAEQPTEVVAEQTNEETPIKEQVESPVEEAKPTTPAKPKLDISEKENKRRIPLRRRANLWSRKVGVKVVLLESIDEVESKEAQSAIREAEKNNQKVSGWVDEGKVYLYLPHVSNTDEIDATYIHEVVAHIGMEEMMGEKEYQQFCLKVWDMMNEEERDYYYNYEGVRDNKNEEKRKARAADEYIAHLAERTNLEERDATMWEKIVDLFTELLAKLGYPKNISRLNIEDAIRESYRNLVESNVIIEDQSGERGTIRYRFIGEKGAANLDKAEEATIRIDNLNTARQMEEAQKSPKTIKMATGWERGADGKWRYEENDTVTAKTIRSLKGAGVKKIREARSQRIKQLDKFAYITHIVGVNQLYDEEKILATSWSEEQKKMWLDIYNMFKDDREGAIEYERKARAEIATLTSFGQGQFMLYEVLGENDSIFKAYPEMRNVKFWLKPYKGGKTFGGYNRLNNTIEVVDFRGLFENDKGEGSASTAAHEIQHIIQGYEGFARGGNMSMLDPNKENAKDTLVASMTEKFNESMAERDALWEQKQELDRKMENWWLDHTDATSEDMNNDPQMREWNKQYDEIIKKHNEAVKNVEFFKDRLIGAEEMDVTLGEDGYKRLAGEVEARNVERRRNMSMMERRNSPAWETEDVARKDQIFISDALESEKAYAIGNNEQTQTLNAKQKNPSQEEVIDERDIQFRISKNNRTTINGWMNKRSDLTEADKGAFLDYIDDLDSKTQLATGKWFANGVIRVPEDMPKVEQAIKVATIAKVDPLQYKSPMELIDRHADIKVKEKPIDPDTVDTLYDRHVVGDTGIVTYEVEESEESRENMRKIINTHFGEEASPWCLLQGDGKGNLTQQSRKYWDHYNAYPKRVAFKDGKLLAFSANSEDEVVWWDRQDESHKGIPVVDKIDDDELGRSAEIGYDEANGKVINVGQYFKGNKQNGTYEQWSPYDDNILIERSTYKDGKRNGLTEMWSYEGYPESKVNFKDGERDGEAITYAPNGNIVQKIHYKNGLRHGTWEAWDGYSGLRTFFANYTDGALNGHYERWHSNGRLAGRGMMIYDQKDGLWEEWDEQGRLTSRTNYNDGLREGLCEIWTNGILRVKALYKGGKLVKDLLEEENNSTPRFRVAPAMDKAYMDAVERGDMDEAQKMVNVVASAAGYSNDESWKKSHRAPRKSEDDVNPFNTEELVPDDYWAHPEWYTNIRNSAYDRESYYNMANAIRKYKRLVAEGKQEEADKVSVTMYRGVDKTANKREGSFRNGDWITPSRSYAKVSAPYGKSRIIEQEVPLKYIWWDGNSINEWGYDDGANYTYKDTKNNRKLLDAVTYDDNGNVIPLSQRFNSRESDIRFRKASATANRNAYNLVREKLQNAGVKVHEVSEEQARQMAEAVGAEYQIVYHGSGAKFDRFDHSFMGTGEGAQAYGWGTYVTQVEGIGKTYARVSLRKQQLESDLSRALEHLPYTSGEVRIGIEELIAEHQKELAEIGSGRNLYTVEIPDSNGEYLQWDGEVADDVVDRLRDELTEEYSEDVAFAANLKYGQTGQHLYQKIERALDSIKAASEFLNRNGFVGIEYPAQHLSGGRADNAKNYVVFNENDLQIIDRVELFQGSRGKIYGWAVGGEIYLTPQGLNANTAIHEYSHLWVEAMRNMDSRQWSGIKEQLKATPFWQQVLDDPNYENIREDEDAVASEVLARLSGNKGAERLANEAQRIIDAGNGNIMARIESTALVQRVKRLLRDFYAWVARNVFGLTNETTISRVADMVVDDLVNEVHLDNIINSPLEAMFIGENGALNLDIAERVANRVNGLDVAIQMSRDMRSSAEIKLATGWEQGADGAWRYEISDKDVHLNMEAMSELNTIFDKNEYRQRNAERIRMFEESRPYLAEKRRDLIEKYSEKSSIVEAFDDLYGLTPVVAEFKLRDLIDYDEAFDAYPKLGDINVRIIEGMDAQGEHWEGNINLSIETSRIPVRMRAVLLHEIQHAIQGYEGFAVGGSVDSAKKIIDRLERDAQIYEFAQKIKREMERFPESSVSDASLDVVNDMVIAAGKNEEDLIAEGRLDPSIIPFAEHAVNNPAEMERVRDSYNILFTLLGEDGTPIPYKAYEQLMGEVEARNTMTRRNMSAEERAKSLAMYTEDVSRENQILRYRKTATAIEEALIILDAKTNGTYLKAPNGKPTNLTPKQWVQVRTKAFKRWFGDWENDPANASKVLDENGEPKVVWHQTNATEYVNVETGERWDDLDWRAKMEWDERDDWDEYWKEQDFYTFDRVNARTTVEFDGFFFAPEYDEYHEYGERAIPAFLNIRKPATREDYDIDYSRNNAGQEERLRLQSEGYDGVIREYDGVVDEYIAFEPNQIKSAEINSGEFDPTDPDIRYRKVYYDAEGNPVKASPISAPKKKLEKRPFRPDSKAGRAFDALWRAFADSQTIVGEYVDGLLQKIGEKEIQRRQQKAGFDFTKREMESLPARIRNKFRNANPIKAYNKLSKSDQILVAKVLSKFNPLIDYMSVQNRSESRGEYEMRSYIENHINPLNEARQRLRDVMGVNDLELEAYVSGEHSLERHKSGIDALSVDEEREWSVGKVTKLVDDFHKRLRNNVKRRIAEEGVGFFSREERKAMGIDLYDKMVDVGFDNLSEEEQNIVLEAPLEIMWSRIRALNDTHLEILLRAGRYSKEDIDRIKSHNWKYYVPLYGHDVAFENLSDPTEVYEFAYRGGSPSNNISFKKAEGRSSKAQDIFLNMYQLGQRCIAFEARNNAKRALLDFTRWTNNQLGAMDTRNLWYEKLSYQVKGEDGKWHSTDAIPSREELAEMRKLNQQISGYRLAVLNYNNRINSIEKLTEAPSSQDAADKLDAELRGLQSKREEALRKIEELEEKKTWEVKRSNGFDAESPSTKDKVEADRTIKVWVDGREVRLVFNDPDVARAVNGTKVWAAKGWAAKALSPIAWLTRTRAQFNTQFSPDFIISNSLRDFQHALIAMALAEQEDVSISFMKNYFSHLGAAFRSHMGNNTPIPSDVLKKFPIYYSYEQMRSAYLEALKSDLNITEEDFEQGYRDMVKANRVALEEEYGKQQIKDTLLEAFHEYGGATGFVHSLNEQAIQKQFREAMLLKNETLVRRYANPVSWARGLADVVSVASETMEDITRFATFLSHLDSGKSVEEAAQEAKEITTNFNRKGELSSGIGSLYMFFNASIQGSAQVMRLVKQHPRRAMAVLPVYAFLGFAQRITKGMLWKVLAFWGIKGLLDDDDELRSIEQLEDEKQIPDYIYSDNMVITLYRTLDALDEVATSGYFFRIPQPNGFRAAYKLGVELGELALGQQSLAELPLSMASTVAGELIYGYNDTGEIGSDLGRMFIPSPTQPAVDLFLNRDFVNRTIYNERTYKPTAPTYTVAKKGTPQIYVEMSKALNSLLGTDTRSADYNKRWEKRQIRLDIPPEAFEYMVNEMFGGLGTFSNRLMTTVELMFKGEDVPLRKIPFVNRVAGEFEPKNVWPEYKTLTDQVDLAWQETAAFRTEEGINMTRKEWKDPSVTYPYMIEHYKDDPNMVEMLRKRWLLKDYFKEVREYSDALKSLGEGGDAVDRASESREMTEQSEKLQADRTLTEKYILEVAKHVDWQAPTNEEVLEQLERVENTIFGD